MTVAMLAPMVSELRPLLRAVPLHRRRFGDLDVYAGAVGQVEVVAALTGIGTRAAAEATERVLGSIPVDHLLVVGIAGGLAPHVAVGDLVVPELVIDAATGREYRASPFGGAAMRGTLSTSDRFVVDPAQLAELAARGVVAVDMETASIAAVCERRGCRWSAFRAISDMAGDTPHAVLGLVRPDGTPNLLAVARFLLTRPWRIPFLVRLARGADLATRTAAAAAVRACARA